MCADLIHIAAAQLVLLLHQRDDRATFRGFISKAGELGRIGQIGLGRIAERNQFRSNPVTECDRAGFVKKKCIDVPGRLDSTAAHGQHVLAQQSIHAGNADGGQQSADRGGNQADQQRNNHGD